jgi:hypothetical protein
MAIASRSASTSSRAGTRRVRGAGLALACAVAVLGCAAPQARADLQQFGGHLSVGFSKLFVEGAPGGSIGMAGGVDYPVVASWRAGVDIGYHLLGTRTVDRGSLIADVDYSLFELDALMHFVPANGLVRRVSIGPALFAPHASINAAGGGAGFIDLARGETAGGLAAGVTLGARNRSPVNLGLELDYRKAFLTEETWTITSIRAVILY